MAPARTKGVEHVCIGCGRHYTTHRSQICTACVMGWGSFNNGQSARDRFNGYRIESRYSFHPRPPTEEENRNPTGIGWRCLPGPAPEADDL